jgi:hypothetical protein
VRRPVELCLTNYELPVVFTSACPMF